MAFDPRPIAGSNIRLTPEVEKLVEPLAINVHNVWADQRLRDGWTVGQERNDARKEHPGLRPFEELPETEQEYDRRVVRDTLRALVAMGYRIERATDSKQ